MHNQISSPRLTIPVALLLAICLAGEAISAEFLPTDENFGAAAMSNDGATLVGGANGVPAIWTRKGGIEIPEWGIESGSLSGVSGDAEKMVGTADGRAFKVVDDALVWLDTPAGYTRARAVGISRDGSTVIGHGRSSSSREKSPGFWNSDGEFRSLEGNGFDPYSVYGVSADGSVIVGTPGFRWTAEEDAQLLPLPSPEYSSSRAYDVSADGRWTVGVAPRPRRSGFQAVRWDGLSDPMELLPVEDWGSWASAVSDDGQTVVGQLQPSSQSATYMAGV